MASTAASSFALRAASSCLILLLPVTFARSQSFQPDSSLHYTVCHSEAGPWGGIYQKVTGGTGTVFLQVYNLKYCAIDLLVFGIDGPDTRDGLYHPQKVDQYFRKVSHDSAYTFYRKRFGRDVLSLTNAVFFEAPTESTRTKLAYPLLLHGTVVSAGESPYGPPSRKYPLQVLQLNDSSLRITNYDQRTGHPLEDAAFPDQLVTLNYRNHPNLKEYPQLEQGYQNRYHLLTAIDWDGDMRDETLLIISSDFVLGIAALAGELQRLQGSITAEKILTLDGGSSISLQDREGNDLIAPGDSTMVPIYLGVRLKSHDVRNASGG